MCAGNKTVPAAASESGLLRVMQTFFSIGKLEQKHVVDKNATAKNSGLMRRRPAKTENGADSSYTMAEVASHDKPGDCWVVIKGKVYDVSVFEHPGGPVLFTHAGRDATDVFSVFHAASTWNVLKDFCIGEVKGGKGAPSPIVEDFRKLRSEMIAEKLFESSKGYYVFKCSSNLALLASACAILFLSSSIPAIICSAFLLGLFWQQCGWLAHDFLHHQVFKERKYNNAVGLIVGNFFQGFSVSWWKGKHNTHHAACNACDELFKPVDPDIDTLPLLAWDPAMLTGMSARHRTVVRYQTYLFFPLLLFARMSWLLQSVTYPLLSATLTASQRKVELALLAAHYTWYLALAFLLLPTSKAFLFVLLSQLFCGGMLSIVFVQSHNGMEVHNEREMDFVSSQIRTTRDITAGLFNNWFTGGLNRQIEHHLFPTLPRHNLGRVASKVRALCEAHGLMYEDVGMGTGTLRVLTRLAEVSAVA
eukprot:jgi/Mesvir1/26670/Mv20454-RA.1